MTKIFRENTTIRSWLIVENNWKVLAQVLKYVFLSLLIFVLVTQKEPFWPRIIFLSAKILFMHFMPRGLMKHDWIINYSGIYISSAMYIQMTEANLKLETFRLYEAYLLQIMVAYTFSTFVATNWKACCINQCLLHLYGCIRLNNKFGALGDVYYLGTIYALVFFIFGSYCYSITLKDEFIASYNNKKTLKGQKEILNCLPEGVLIANKHNEYKYVNSKIKQTLNIKGFCRSESVQDIVNVVQDSTNKRLDSIVEDFSVFDSQLKSKARVSSNQSLANLLEKYYVKCTSSKFGQDGRKQFNQQDESYQSDDQRIQDFDDYRRRNKTLGFFLQAERKSLIEGMDCSKESKIRVKYELDGLGEQHEQQNREFIVKTTTVDGAGSSGKDSSYIHMFIDTTQISQLEEAKAQNHYQRQMLSNVSHEFRTPLNSIMASLELMRTQEYGKNNRFVQIASSSCSILSMLVEDILDHAKIESGVFQINEEAFTMTQCIQEIQEVFTLQADGKGIELIIDIQENLKELPILSDKQRLKQVLLNLASNSLKFTDHGSITIKICDKERDREEEPLEESKFYDNERNAFNGSMNCSEMSNNFFSKNDCKNYFFKTNISRFQELQREEDPIEFNSQIMISLSVIDTGIGISKVDQKSLFKLFSKLSSNHNRNKTGCGLGLTICKKLIEKMGGKITLSSEEGIGTTVECYFPCKCPNPSV
ncbi:unnamed protein product [Moneuplotes crassus]|uniref:histidine kinase n=1 Tax=Euplotes crassus TaxID=5936 RepID=A0AAD1Y269_EUPCR|nr:unnamed protein product [Moneuplotes crassus]